MKWTATLVIIGLAGCSGGSPYLQNAMLPMMQAISKSPAWSQMLGSLSGREQQQRQQALADAARGSTGTSAGWASHDQGTRATKAHYVKKGETTNEAGQKCSKVQETITMPDGKSGTSEELVCS